MSSCATRRHIQEIHCAKVLHDRSLVEKIARARHLRYHLKAMCSKITTRVAAFALCVCLVISTGFPLSASVNLAQADELSDAQATLASAESQLSAVASEYNSIQARVAEVESKINETTSKAQEAQAAMLEGQKELGRVMVSSYKNEATSSLVNVFLGSDSIESFIRNVTYYSSIEQQKAAQIAEQKKLNDDFSAVLSDLDTQMNEQEELAAQAKQKKDEAEQIVASASAKVSSIESERARVAALQEQANSLQSKPKPSTSSNTSTSKNWNTKPSGNDASGSDAPSAAASGGWRTGVASAYGGSSDGNTPNPGTTATGARCDDNSMGVAVPMSWADYRSYYGRSVEIKYGNRTVIATVNDCGGFGKYGRDLDLQPGVFKALGFSTCQAWGARTITYRFL